MREPVHLSIAESDDIAGADRLDVEFIAKAEEETVAGRDELGFFFLEAVVFGHTLGIGQSAEQETSNSEWNFHLLKLYLI